MMFLADDRGNQWPDFFEQAPILRVQDDLARFLGAAGSGVLTYRYVDAVRALVQIKASGSASAQGLQAMRC